MNLTTVSHDLTRLIGAAHSSDAHLERHGDGWSRHLLDKGLIVKVSTPEGLMQIDVNVVAYARKQGWVRDEDGKVLLTETGNALWRELFIPVGI